MIKKIRHLGLREKLKIKLAQWQMHGDRRKLYVAGGVVVILMAFAIWGGSHIMGKKSAKQRSSLRPVPTLAVGEVGEPKTKSAILDGVKITESEYQRLEKRRPLAIMVENHPAARPQSGLAQAELVWEALVEGGITRFMPVYWRNAPEVVGPVRSARKYFLDWSSELGDALYMHIGGAVSDNPEANALLYIQEHGLKSLGISGRDTFWRVSGRRAPHNAYSDSRHLWDEAERLGWGGLPPMEKWKFKDDAPLKERGSTTEITLNWNGWGQNLWSVRWVFDREKNEYLRFHQVDEPHLDALTQKQLTAKNVVVAFMRVTPANDGSARVVYKTTGEGRALIFRDGQVIEGRWQKRDRTDRTRFYDQEGKEVEFNRGRTWIMAVPENSELTY